MAEPSRSTDVLVDANAAEPPGLGGVELRLLECFLVLADELHFGRAARRLHMAQSGLTRAIQTLERRLALELVVRDSRHVGLTEAGEGLIEPCRDVLAQHRELLGCASRLRQSPTTGLTIAIDAAFAGLLVSAAVVEHRTRHPGVRLELRWVSYGLTASEALEGGADALLGAGPSGGAEVCSQRILETKPMLVVGRGHRLAPRSEVSLAELEHEPQLEPRAAPARSRCPWTVAGLTGAMSECGGEFDRFEEGLELAAGGLGALIAPSVARARYLRADLRWIRIRGVEPVGVEMKWLVGRERMVRSFVEAVAMTAKLQAVDCDPTSDNLQAPRRERRTIAEAAR